MSSTTTEPKNIDRSNDPAPTGDASTTGKPATADAGLDGIDETLRQAEGADNDDPAPASLVARLKLLVPRHTMWKSATMPSGSIPQVIQRLAETLGADLADATTGHIAIWTTGEGDWQPTGMYHVMWTVCAVHKGEHRVQIDAPGVDVEREHLTVDQVVDLLKATGVVR